ncbi:methylmalonyl Co-A mutase-associated GTPase MeaB [Cloacibacillus porcorum]|uniref:methylmalonyl Co-A mutase-associated GTPase MeaB n=1 Tax=Cloacibacillus porcorum TaxID=1197717 RepID=UPI0023EFAB75|nr:methylmalonyl Co-A mutase-associated GTPase MeaB [Cloacibacillus porcorum]MDD7648994.1 methylmalonyl Co-A mutase-associated GTPase MeaB [Cloacibacillus porcorum]MDY4092233.1 methylmalonyl Co-A mutase-associated GTPase MeaB [Cloacibacillus porcorum]
MRENLRPDWQPEDAGAEFACSVMPGVPLASGHNAAARSAAPAKARTALTAKDYAQGILAGDRVMLSRAITVIESNAPKHFELGQEIIQKILPHSGKAMRVGITGVPGAGKSTFIEAFGTYLCGEGLKVAVLAVDPSSSLSKGSILGDKTRMENLAREKNAFIRPSPSGGSLGGVTRKSRETMLLCEAAGYDAVLVETVGVGQSETMVRSMVDYFLVVVITGAGDDLQGIKKGIIELADSILVNKADGDNKMKAMMARADYDQILHYLRPATEGWKTKAYTCSSITGEGIADMWGVIKDFRDNVIASGVFSKRRKEQTIEWVRAMTAEYLQNKIAQNAELTKCREDIERKVIEGAITPTVAAKAVIGSMERLLFTGTNET